MEKSDRMIMNREAAYVFAVHPVIWILNQEVKLLLFSKIWSSLPRILPFQEESKCQGFQMKKIPLKI